MSVRKAYFLSLLLSLPLYYRCTCQCACSSPRCYVNPVPGLWLWLRDCHGSCLGSRGATNCIINPGVPLSLSLIHGVLLSLVPIYWVVQSWGLPQRMFLFLPEPQKAYLHSYFSSLSYFCFSFSFFLLLLLPRFQIRLQKLYLIRLQKLYLIQFLI